jgi:glycine cleavage system regulatory protein
VTSSLVVTILGRDRPGLVGAVSEAALAHGANWEASRMVRLGGQFAGVVLLTVAAERAAALRAALARLEGLTVSVHDSEPARPAARPVRLELVGNDRPGILREIARALAARGVNVEDLHTECVSAPMTGALLFELEARLDVPAELRLEELRRELEAIAHDLMIDLQLADDEPR